jgi:uncharacterized protein YecT (DUF1311 family)
MSEQHPARKSALWCVRFILSLTLIVSCPVTSHAQHMNATGSPCNKPMSGAEQTQCYINASRQRDIELNLTYHEVFKVLASDEAVQLRTAQNYWMQFRDSTCHAEKALYTGGSAAPMVYYACMEAETRYRINDLKNIYEWRMINSRP